MKVISFLPFKDELKKESNASMNLLIHSDEIIFHP